VAEVEVPKPHGVVVVEALEVSAQTSLVKLLVAGELLNQKCFFFLT
jgi:hypothetical protein